MAKPPLPYNPSLVLGFPTRRQVHAVSSSDPTSNHQRLAGDSVGSSPWLLVMGDSGKGQALEGLPGKPSFLCSLPIHLLVIINNSFFSLFILNALAVLLGPADAHFTFLDFLSS